jgi:hypothetical protein
MRLFAPDLYRNFGIGFVAGALLIAGATAESWSHELASPAHAAENRSATNLSADSFFALSEQPAK